MAWSELGRWWLDELDGDPAYETVVTPLLIEILQPTPGASYADLGCGEGRVMRTLEAMGASVIGLDLNLDLAFRAGTAVVARLPTMPFRDDSLENAFAVLLLEHLEDVAAFFREVARVVGSGVLAVVMNHPLWTAPESTPLQDRDGELLWRPGEYFRAGMSEIDAGDHTVAFHHRSVAYLLSSAADAGWSLEEMIERPHQVPGAHLEVPRLLACRWRRMASVH